KAAHPNTIIFLTADAFGVLPPISKLSKDQAMYHFLSGFTAKLAGTERGITEPEPSFSTCLGSPFLPLHAKADEDLLGNLIDKHDVDVYLVITGQLRDTEYIQHDMFGLNIPVEVDDVPQTLLNPINAWSKPESYREQAQDLIDRFKHNFEKFGDEVSDLAQNGGF